MTQQATEILHYKGDEIRISAYPFRQYKESHDIEFTFISTMNREGYVAEWSIENQELFLVSFKGSILSGNVTIVGDTKKRTFNGRECVEVYLKNLFQDENKVLAEWYSGTIRIPIFDTSIPNAFQIGKVDNHTIYSVINGARGKDFKETAIARFLSKQDNPDTMNKFTKTEIDNALAISAERMRQYERFGFFPIEKDLLLEFNEGILVSENQIENDPPKEKESKPFLPLFPLKKPFWRRLLGV